MKIQSLAAPYNVELNPFSLTDVASI